MCNRCAILTVEENESFIGRCLAGKAEPDQIDDYIKLWHEPSAKSRPLYKYLGFTQEDFSIAIYRPEYLTDLLASRNSVELVTEVLRSRHRHSCAWEGSTYWKVTD